MAYNYIKDFVKLMGYMIVQLVEALCYKMEGLGFDPHWGL